MATLKCGSCPKVYFSPRGLRSHRNKAHKELSATGRSEINLSEDNSPVVLPIEDDNYVIDLAKYVDLEELVDDSLVKILKLKFGQNVKDEFWSRL